MFPKLCNLFRADITNASLSISVTSDKLIKSNDSITKFLKALPPVGS